MGGTSGIRVERFAVVTASTLSFPALTCGIEMVKSATMKSSRPATRSRIACVLTLYGTPTIDTLAIVFMVSAATSDALLACP
jgi:hypothetical protein